METIHPPETNETMIASLSYVLREEDDLAKIWNDQDRTTHLRGVRESIELSSNLHQRLEKLQVWIDGVWERFVTLTLERALSKQLREFLDEIDLETQELNQKLVEMDCEIDRLRVRVQEQRRWLEEKSAALEPLIHRASTQNHLNMMLSRVEELETHLLSKKDVVLNIDELHDHKRYSSASSDLLYLRVRLLTTRVAVIASSHGKQLSECDAELVALLPDIGRLKTDLVGLTARIECISELSRYWLAYLDIALPERDLYSI